MMIYVLMGLISAAFFGIGAVGVYGPEGLLENVWVDYVFWWLIGTGALLALVENAAGRVHRLCRWLRHVPGLHSAVPCH